MRLFYRVSIQSNMIAVQTLAAALSDHTRTAHDPLPRRPAGQGALRRVVHLPAVPHPLRQRQADHEEEDRVLAGVGAGGVVGPCFATGWRLRPGADDLLDLLDDAGEEPLREAGVGEDRDDDVEHVKVPSVARVRCAVDTEK